MQNQLCINVVISSTLVTFNADLAGIMRTMTSKVPIWDKVILAMASSYILGFSAIGVIIGCSTLTKTIYDLRKIGKANT